MNKRAMQIMLRQSKRVASILTLLAFTFLTFIPKNGITQENDITAPHATIIKYLGLLEDKLLFQVDIDNNKLERCSISIQDENGYVLYRQEFKGTRFNKTFGIKKDELESRNIVFVFFNGKTKHEQVYQVSTNTRVVQDVVIVKQ